MKKTFLSFMSMFMLTVFAVAQSAPKFSELVPEEIYYLYNVETHAFVTGGNDWGTRASGNIEKGNQVKIVANGETYKITDLLPSGSWNAIDVDGNKDSWVDGQGRSGDGTWVITPNGDKTYSITNTVAAGLKWGLQLDLVNSRTLFMTNESCGYTWAFVSEADYEEYMASIDVEAINKLLAANTDKVNEANKGAVNAANEKALNAMKGILEGTNIYGEGYTAYAEKYADLLAKYEAGTLTEAIVNPNAATGWHSSTEFNFLLTPWTIGGAACNNFDKGLYINTWSVEGQNDGSNFLVPFFEYWTGDDASLGENVLATTVSGLNPGAKYNVTAWARVRIKNNGGADAYGITLSAGDASVDVCKGDKVGDTQFRIINAVVEGTADAQGNLVIAFNIAADNNVSWLSYKDVKYVATLPMNVTDKAPASWVGETGKVADWAWPGHEGAAEIYNGGGSVPAGDVLTQTITGLENGEYEVTLEVAASYTSGRGFECPVGDGLAEVFANKTAQNLEVVERTSATGIEPITLNAIVTDGTLTYGIRNLAPAGNWYLASLKSIMYNGEVKGIAEGDYIIKNVETGLYLGGANSWGTQASLVKHGQVFTAVLVDGKYKLDSHTYNKAEQHFLSANGFIDGDGCLLDIEKVAGGYTMATDGSYFASVDGKVVTADAANPAQVWEIISVADAIANLQPGDDATFVIKAANFSRNHYNANFEPAWTVEASNKNLSGGAVENACAESWRSAFNIYQTISNMPNGTYVLNAQAALTDYTEAYDGTEYPVVYANGRTSVFNNMDEADRGSNMTQLSGSFTDGKYAVKPITFKVKDGVITLGVKGTRTDTWCIWDNFELTFLGETKGTVELGNPVYGIEGGKFYGVDAKTAKVTVAFAGAMSEDEDLQASVKAGDVTATVECTLFDITGTTTAVTSGVAAVDKGMEINLAGMLEAGHVYILKLVNVEMALNGKYLQSNDFSNGHESVIFATCDEATAKAMLAAYYAGDATAVQNANTTTPTIVAIYGANGARQNSLKAGLNIVKYSDGTTVKISK